MKIISLKDISIKDIVSVLRDGGLIIYPFDTCYGLVCDPTNQKAVDKLLEYKSRREGKAISIVVKDKEMIEQYAEVNNSTRNFIQNFLPGPFTVILKSKNKFAKGIQAENGTIGIRIPKFQPILDLVKAYGSPLTATSANQSYKKTPYKISDILDNTSAKGLRNIDLIVDAGELDRNPPSTVIDLCSESIHVLRKGSIIPENSSFTQRESNSVEETIEIGRELMEKYQGNLEFRPVIFALQGDMGAGKTHFTKGLGISLGVRGEINSPTFVISNEYELENGNKLYHIDTWRIDFSDDFRELDEIGFRGMLKKQKNRFNVISIEWSDKIYEYLRKLDENIKIIWVEIIIDYRSEHTRIIKWSE